MRKLLSAGMLRLRKNRLFYLGNAVLFCLGIFFAVGKYFDMQRFQIKQYLDDCLFLHVIFAGCCASVFCSLFTGTEFSSGTIRNKLIVGQTRRDVYLSDLIVCLLSTLCMTAAFLLSYCSFGLALLLPPQLPWKGIGIYLCISLFTITAYVSIFHMLSMLVSKKTISAVTCLLLFIGLFLLAVNIQSRIFAPQYLTDYIMTADGYTETTPYPNPKYLTGMAKEVYKFFFDFLPSGQSLQIASEMVKHPALIALYSLGITILTTLAGILGFQKNDLN